MVKKKTRALPNNGRALSYALMSPYPRLQEAAVETIREALEASAGDSHRGMVLDAADALGVGPNTLYVWLKDHPELFEG